MKRRIVCIILAVLMLTGAFAGCGNQTENPSGDTPVTPSVILTIAGGWEDCKAIEAVGREFTAQNPECKIVYEYLQDYYTSLAKRMSGENVVDIFFTTNIQEGNEMLPYAYDLNSAQGLDFSATFDGLLENFAYMEGGTRSNKLYAIPLGAEMRGLYINKTLLDSLGIAIPKNQAETLAACEKLKENGYIPFQGNPGDFSQMLLYPWICNIIANAEDPQAAYDKVNSRSEGMSEMFREPFEFLYTLVENGYYDYKRAQTELNLFNDNSSEDYARYFFNIESVDDVWTKTGDVGKVAFMPSPMSMQSVMSKTKEDYHSAIEYVFVPAPIGNDGGFAYMSPAHGIAINKDSAQLEWSVKFMNFLFQEENNKLFASEFNIIPNTKEAFSYVSAQYDIPSDRISHLGQVTFDYGFYGLVTASLLDVSKSNNPKYMQTADDGTASLYPLDHYMNLFEESLKGDE